MLRPQHALRLPVMIKSAFATMMEHDGLNIAQSAAYSAIIALFPALIVVAAIIALLPDVAPLKVELGAFFGQILPDNVLPLVRGYFVSTAGSAGATPRTVRALFAAGFVSLSGASSVIATLMEGFRRAKGSSRDGWTFWQRRLRAWALVPLSLLPLAVATVLVMFGRLMSEWMALHLSAAVTPAFFAVALLVRWVVALAGVVGLTALLYHMGSRRPERDTVQESWLRTLPGAVMATVMWFVATLGFGWYVTRLANYSQVYGSLGAGIALLFWLFIVFLSVLCGAEFNVQVWDSVERGAGMDVKPENVKA